MSKGATAEKLVNGQAAFQLMASLLDTLDQALFVSDRSGRVLFTNLHAQDVVNEQGLSSKAELNLFRDVLRSDLEGILGQLQAGEQEVNLRTRIHGRKEPCTNPLAPGTGLARRFSGTISTRGSRRRS